MPFDNVEEVNYLLQNMSKVMGLEGSNNEAGNSTGNTIVQYGFQKNEISRNTRFTVAGSEDEMSMAKMMLGAATYQAIYQLPGKVKKAKIPGAIEEENIVKTSTSYADLLDEKKNLDGTILFK